MFETDEVPMRRIFFALALLIVLAHVTPATVQAAAVHDFHDAAALAYRHYRAAMFYLRTGNAMVASFELEQMARRWNAVIDRFGTAPPDVYSTDFSWEKTLRDIQKRADSALETAARGDAKAARKQIMPIRRILSALRKRNGVTAYSDTVDAANAAFARLWRYRHKPPDFSSVGELDRLRQALAVTIHWCERVQADAPPAIRDDEEFKRLMDRHLSSLGRVWVAIKEKSRLNLINILRELHSSDDLLFLKFG